MDTTYNADGVALSGRERTPEKPRAVLLALHGGGYSSGYWDYPGQSLLEAAAARGYRAVAVERPGYGAAYDEPLDIPGQAAAMLDLVRRLGDQTGGVPVVVTGHSMGGILALHMAGHAQAHNMVAIEVSGVPLRTLEGMREALLSWQPPEGARHMPPQDPETVRHMFFGPESSYSPEAFAYGTTLNRPIPVAELAGAANATTELPEIMHRISIPVRVTFAALEGSSIVNDEVLEAARSHLSGNARADVHVVADTAHNIALHHAASRHHAAMLDWFDAVLERG